MAQSFDECIRELGSSDYKVRVAGANALGRLGDARALEPLALASRDADRDVRSAALRALGALHDPGATEALFQGLHDHDWRVRLAAAKALGQACDRRAVEALVWGLGDGDEDVRRAAAHSLAQLGEGALVGAVERAMEGGPDDLVQLGDPRAVELLIRLLASDKRVVAAKALGRCGDARAIEPLVGALGSGSFVYRQAAAEALGQLGEPGLAEAVLRALDGDAVPIERLGDARAAVPLLCALGVGDRETRRAAARALGALTDAGAVEALVNALLDLDRNVRDAAAEALARIGAPAEAWLLARLEAGLVARRQTADALIRSGRPYREAAEAAPPGAPSELLCAIVEALGRLGDPRAVGPLMEALDDPDLRVGEAAVVALGMIGAPSGAALERLRAITTSVVPSRAVRLSAVCNEAIDKIEAALRKAPAELLSAPEPSGRGTEPEAADVPRGRGTEPEAAGG